MNNLENKLQSNKIIIALGIVCCFLWGSAFPTLKILYDQLKIDSNDLLSVILIAGIRFLIAGIILLLFNKYYVKEKTIIEKNISFQIIILGIVQTTIQYSAFYIALANTTAIKSSVLSQSGIVFLVILTPLVYKGKRITTRQVIGLIVGLIGIVVINFDKNAIGGIWSFKLMGEGLFLLTGLCSAIGTILAKKLSNKINPITVTAYQMFIGASILVIVGFPRRNEIVSNLNMASILLIIYSALISAVAFAIWYILLKYNSPVKISVYKLMIPVFGSILSAIMLPNEVFSSTVVLGLVLVVFCIYIINTDKR